MDNQRVRRPAGRVVSAALLGLVAALVATFFASTGATAATSQWRDVLDIDQSSTALTVRELHARAQSAAGTPLPLPDQAAVFAGTVDPSWDALVAAAAGQQVPGLRLYSMIGNPRPTASLGDLTNGPTIPQANTVVKVKIVCKGDKCKIKIKIRTTD